MKYYSEILDTLFDSEDELIEAERLKKEKENERREKETLLNAKILEAANAKAEAEKEFKKLCEQYCKLHDAGCVLEKDETGKYVKVSSRKDSLFQFFNDLY